MRKKLWMILGIIVCIAIIGIVVHLERKSNTASCIMEEINKDVIKEKMIGSEPPRLLYADHNKVIFESVDIYIYDIVNKKLLNSFDVSSLLSEKYKDCRYQTIVSSDGKEMSILFKDKSGVFEDAFNYSFQSNKWKEMNESEYESKADNVFECTLIDADNGLSKVTSGYAVYLSKSEYFYLTYKDWKVSEINIVYVNNGEENIYKVFE